MFNNSVISFVMVLVKMIFKMKYREPMFTIYLYDNQKSQSKKGHKGIMSNNSVISFVMVLVKIT